MVMERARSLSVKERWFWGSLVATLVFLTIITPRESVLLWAVFIGGYFAKKHPSVSKCYLFFKKNTLKLWIFLAIVLVAWFYFTAHPAQDVVRQYLNAASIEERLECVMDPERVKPLMEKHYKHTDLSGGVGYLWVAKPRKHGHRVRVAALRSLQHAYTYTLLLFGGKYKIDWEASVVYNPMSFQEMIAKTPTFAQKFRVYARLGNYYNYEFGGAQRTHYCIELRESRTDECLWGYITKNSEDGRRLYEALEEGGWQPITIGMGYLPGGKSNEHVVITNFIQKYFNVY